MRNRTATLMEDAFHRLEIREKETDAIYWGTYAGTMNGLPAEMRIMGAGMALVRAYRDVGKNQGPGQDALDDLLSLLGQRDDTLADKMRGWVPRVMAQATVMHESTRAQEAAQMLKRLSEYRKTYAAAMTPPPNEEGEDA